MSRGTGPRRSVASVWTPSRRSREAMRQVSKPASVPTASGWPPASSASATSSGTRKRARRTTVSQHSEHYRFRNELVERLERDLLGPANGEWETLTDAPVTTYATGALFPRRVEEERARTATAEFDVDLAPAGLTVDETPDTGVSLENLQTPSSMGLTIAVDPKISPIVMVTVAAAMYEPIDKNGAPEQARRAARRTTEEQDLRWRRRTLRPDPVTVDVTGQSRRILIAEGVELRLRVRGADPETGVVAVTAALMNVAEIGAYDLQDAHCLFQPRIVVSGPDSYTHLTLLLFCC